MCSAIPSCQENTRTFHNSIAKPLPPQTWMPKKTPVGIQHNTLDTPLACSKSHCAGVRSGPKPPNHDPGAGESATAGSLFPVSQAHLQPKSVEASLVGAGYSTPSSTGHCRTRKIDWLRTCCWRQSPRQVACLIGI